MDEDDSDDTANESSKAVHMCDSLDMALAWCEDCIIRANAIKLEKALAAEEQSLSNIIASDSGDGTDNVSRLTKISTTYLNLFTASSTALNVFAGGGSASEPLNDSNSSGNRDQSTDSGAIQKSIKQSPSSKSLGVSERKFASMKSRKASFLVPTVPPHMLQLLALCPDEPLKVEKLGG